MDVFGVVGAQEKYLRDAVLRAASELRLWPALPATAGGAAGALGISSPRRLRRLLDALALFGFARREGEVFHESSHAAPGPVPDAGWGQLAGVIRTDRPIAAPGVSGENAPEALRLFHAYLFETGAAPARELWGLLASGFRLLARSPVLVRCWIWAAEPGRMRRPSPGRRRWPTPPQSFDSRRLHGRGCWRLIY